MRVENKTASRLHEAMPSVERKREWSELMDEKQNQKCKCVELGIKFALSFAILFPIYAFLFVTFPGSIVALYLISAVLFGLFAPWDSLKKRFLS